MNIIDKIKKFVNNVVNEMKKVAWPSKEQLRESTIVVIVVTFIISGFVLIIDQIMSKIIQVIF